MNPSVSCSALLAHPSAVAMAAALLCCSPAAWAQTVASEPAKDDSDAVSLTRVVVTAQKRPQFAEQVPMSIEALDLVRERCRTHAIDCDLQDGFIGVATNPRKGRAQSQWADRIERLYGYEMPRINPQDMRRWVNSPRYDSGVYDPRSGHLHPLKYALGLARAARQAGVRIHEHSAVTRIERGATVTLHTTEGQVSARQALLAGNVYLQGVAPMLEARIMAFSCAIADS